VQQSPALATTRFLRVYEDCSRYIELAFAIGYESARQAVRSSRR
jgi:hypothetical protein